MQVIVKEGRRQRETEKEVGGQHQGMDRLGIRQVPEGSGEQRKMEETGYEIICGAPTTLAVKGWVKVNPPPQTNKDFVVVSWCFKPSQPQKITSGLNKQRNITSNN